MKRKIFLLSVFTSCILSLSFMCGCSGSSSFDGGFAASEGSYGKVGILITDGPADDYDSIFVTITDVLLLPAGCECDDDNCKPVAIFECNENEEGIRIDILEYREKDYLLALNEKVPAGIYDKIRLKISRIEPYGGPCESMKLPSGKIDLNPREPIIVEEGSLMYVRMDIDANKSINISNSCNFRPVVFVDILTEELTEMCQLVIPGMIKELSDTNNDEVADKFMLEREIPSQGTLQVLIDEDTRIFNEQGLFAGVDVLKNDQNVTVWGNLYNGSLHATLIIIGDAVFLNGTVNSIVDDNSFILVPDEGEEISGSLEVHTLNESLVFTGCDYSEDYDLQEGMYVRVVGKYITEADALRAAVVMIMPEEISGYVNSVVHDDGGYWFTIVPDGGTPQEIFIPSGADIHIEGDGPVPADMIELLACGQNRVKVTIEGTVTKMLVQASVLSGEVESVDDKNLTIEVNGHTVSVMPYSTSIYTLDDDCDDNDCCCGCDDDCDDDDCNCGCDNDCDDDDCNCGCDDDCDNDDCCCGCDNDCDDDDCNCGCDNDCDDDDCNCGCDDDCDDCGCSCDDDCDDDDCNCGCDDDCDDDDCCCGCNDDCDYNKLISIEKINGGDKITCFGLETCPDNPVDFFAFVILVTD